MNRTYLTNLVLFAFTLALSQANEAQLTHRQQVWAAWNSAKQSAHSGVNLNAATVVETGSTLRQFLLNDSTSTLEDKEKIASELVDYTAALAWAKEGNFERATQAFRAEVSYQHSSRRIFLENTRMPEFFAVEVFSLHSLLLANTPTAKNIENLGYDFFEIEKTNNEKGFTFVYGSDGEFQSEFTTEGVEKNEQKKIIYLMEADRHGHYGIVDRAQVIADRDNFKVSVRREADQAYLVFNGVTKIIEYLDVSGYPKVHISPVNQIELRVGSGKIEQPLAAISNLVQPKQHPKTPSESDGSPVPTPPSKFLGPAPERKMGAPNDRQSAATSWTLWVLILSASIGVVWLVLKNRK